MKGYKRESLIQSNQSTRSLILHQETNLMTPPQEQPYVKVDTLVKEMKPTKTLSQDRQRDPQKERPTSSDSVFTLGCTKDRLKNIAQKLRRKSRNRIQSNKSHANYSKPLGGIGPNFDEKWKKAAQRSSLMKRFSTFNELVNKELIKVKKEHKEEHHT